MIRSTRVAHRPDRRRILNFVTWRSLGGHLKGFLRTAEVAIATATILFGLGSGAALVTVVGVLIEVPVMLMLVRVCLRTRGWFPGGQDVPATEARIEQAPPDSTVP